jgi:hypothetical protein
MRRTFMGVTAGALLLLVSTLAYADPPAGVGAAVTESGFVCFFNVVVAPGTGTFTPILPGGYGILAAVLADNSKAVFTNSANGNESLLCTGDTAPGTAVTGTDFVTGEEVTGVIAEVGEACDALEPVFPDVCTPGRGAVIVDFESSGGFTCDLFGSPAEDWRQVTTRGGRSMVSCHLPAN